MSTNALQTKLKAAYEDTKKFVVDTYQEIKKDRKKSIIALAVSATVFVGLLSIMFSGGSSESQTKVVTVNHGDHRYIENNKAPKLQEDNAYTTAQTASTEEDVTNQSPLGNGDALDGDGVQTQYMKYTVDNKESLYSIAKKIYGSSHYWVLIYEKNKHLIKDPDLIFAGQEIEVPFRSDGNLSWDKEELVENYIEVYKTYRKHEKLKEVYWLLYTGVKRIDPDLLAHYKAEIKKFDRAFAQGDFSGIPPEADSNS